MAEFLLNFLTAAPALDLLLIFITKIIEVTVGTLRLILINKGYRREGTILSFVEILLWTFVASSVLLGLVEAPIKGIVYSLAYSAGIYLGSRIEGIVAMGRVLIQAIVSDENSEVLINGLREKGYAVTTVDAKGRDSNKKVLMIYANRKGMDKIIEEILSLDSKAMIISNDVSSLRGGTIAEVRRGLIK